MPLKKLSFKPGVNRENTRYTTEGGYYDCDKIRFRQGTPEKIGGWQAYTSATYLGTARTLWPWATLAGIPYLGIGTNLKYYIFYGILNDITPIRETTAPGAVTFAATNGSSTITATDTAHGAITGDFVTFSGAVSLGGNITAAVLNQEYQITVLTANTYTFTAKDTSGNTVTANASDVGNGGASVVGAYQINVGLANQNPNYGWGAGGWGNGGWGVGEPSSESLRIWNAQNFGEDLLYGPQNGPLYYWDASLGLTTRGVALTSLSGASEVPTVQKLFLVSDQSRIVLAFGCNPKGSSVQDPMLIRWSDQESAVNWNPAATNQAGDLRLSHGSAIEAVAQVRQEILVWTDTALYSMQYLGPPEVYRAQLLADNISIISDRVWATAAGVTYWMGEEKFYVYDGRTNTLPCDVRHYIFSDFNKDQSQQVFATTVEQFNEVWWFYCSSGSDLIDKYVVFNYLEKIWYYGSLSRTAWIDASIVSDYPIATSGGVLLNQEYGVDDNTTATPAPIAAYITTSEFDIDDGHNFGFVWRVLPDLTFRGSTAQSPTATMTLLPLQNSGSGYNNPQSLGGSSSGAVVRSATVPIEQFTGQIPIRVRGRQMSMKIESSALGVTWQLGSPRIDIKPDGRKS